MAAPIDAFIQLPDDSGNAGKKVRTQTRVVAGNTVHEHFMVPISQKRILGCYVVNINIQAILNAAHTPNTTAFAYFTLPVAATCAARIRRVELCFSANATTTTVTTPRVGLSRSTFTGTTSATLTTPMKRKTSDSAAQLLSAIAMTGYTVTTGANGLTWLCPAIPFTTSGEVMAWANPIWDPNNEDEFIDLQAGEGITIWQQDAGTASDPRKIGISMMWDEYDIT
jgi:hypothetical protein